MLGDRLREVGLVLERGDAAGPRAMRSSRGVAARTRLARVNASHERANASSVTRPPWRCAASIGQMPPLAVGVGAADDRVRRGFPRSIAARVAAGRDWMARSSAVIGSRTPPTVRRGPASDNGWEDACSEARAAHRILGPRADRAAAARARAGGRAARLRLGLDRGGLRLGRGDDPRLARAGDDDDQARLGDLPDARPLGRDDGDDRGDDRPALRRADAARDRHERAAGGRGLARAAVRAASSSARASTSRSCGWRWRASGSSSTARR